MSPVVETLKNQALIIREHQQKTFVMLSRFWILGGGGGGRI